MLNKRYFYLDDAAVFLTAQLGHLFSQDDLIDWALNDHIPLFIRASDWRVKHGILELSHFDGYCPIDPCTLNTALEADRKNKGEISFVHHFSIKITEVVRTVFFPELDMVSLDSATATSCPFTIPDLVVKYEALLKFIELHCPADDLVTEKLPLFSATETSCPPAALTDLVTKQDGLIVSDSIKHRYPLIFPENIALENVTKRLRTQEPSHPNIFRKNITGTWNLKFNGLELPSLPDRTGFAYIQHLLKNPDKDICASELNSFLSKTIVIHDQEAIGALIGEGLSIIESSNAGQCIDSLAIKQYKARMEALKDLIEEALESDDIEAKENYMDELVKLDKELKKNTNSKGKPKTDKSDIRKISQAVSLSIKNAIKEIVPQCPDLANHLTDHIRKGKICRYRSLLSTAWEF